MGITGFSINLIEKYKNGAKNVMELGAQNLYDRDYGFNFPYADTYYKAKGMEYACIDINGENGALMIDLEKPNKFDGTYDLVTDFGTSEHIRDGYNVHKTIYDLCKEGGIIIHENPKTGNWKGHGFNYKTKEFYTGLAELTGMEILELGEHPAMGNTKDGWNVYCVMRKGNGKFPSKSKFKELDLRPE
jgi:hypothetical protein